MLKKLTTPREHFNAVAERMLGELASEPPEVPEVSLEQPQGEVIQLPFWREPERAAPSVLLRSALFSVGRKGSRPNLKRAELAAWNGTSILYTGEKLDQWDEDVWLQTLHLNRLQDLPRITYATNRSFLKTIGRPGNGQNIERLHKSLERLVACAVTVQTPAHRYVGSMLSSWALEEATGRLALQLNPEIAELFSENISKIDWEARRALRTDLAKWLHAYVQTHRAIPAQPHRVPVQQLLSLSGSTTSLKDFRYKLKKACELLKAKSVLESWAITPNDALEVVRPSRRPALASIN